jgi:cell division septum initiation protein DivIVA
LSLLTPEDIQTAALPRATIRGYDRRSTDDLLRRIASDTRALLDERCLLEEEVRRLKEELTQRERVMEMQETAKRECDLILKKARRQADKILDTAAKETVARVEALKRVEEVHGLVRVELRTLLGAMLEALNAPSDVVRESLKNPRLAEDLQRITRAAFEASAVAAPDISAESEVDESVEEDLSAPKTSRLVERVTGWTPSTGWVAARRNPAQASGHPAC